MSRTKVHKYLIMFMTLCFIACAGLPPAMAAAINPAGPAQARPGDTIEVALVVSGAAGTTIRAWGMDIMFEGLEYVGIEKQGTLIEGSSTFGSNQLGANRVRCGAYAGEIALQDGAPLLKLKMRVKPDAVQAGIVDVVAHGPAVRAADRDALPHGVADRAAGDDVVRPALHDDARTATALDREAANGHVGCLLEMHDRVETR